MNRLHRRRFCQALGLSGALLPLLGMTRVGHTAPSAFPRRLVIIYWPNGIYPMDFWPVGGETDFQLGQTLSPLAPYRDHLVVLGGLDLQSRIDNVEGDQFMAMGHDAEVALLTGTRYDVFLNQDFQAGGPSVDQFIAAQLQARDPTPFPSLVLGAAAGGPTSLSWRGASDSVSWENDPKRVFDRLFGSPNLGEAELQSLRQRRKSVLDYVGKDLERFAGRLGEADRQKVQAHFTSIRELENEVAGPLASDACVRPELPTAPGQYSPDAFPAIIRAQMDLLLTALRCGLTRVATLKCESWNGDGYIFPWLGAEFTGPADEPGRTIREHHDIAHMTHKSPDNIRRKIMVDKWYYEQVAYLVKGLAETPEGDGSMLDNSTVLVMSNMDDGDWHNIRGMPFTLIGSCGEHFRTGRFLKLGGWAALSGNYWGDVTRRGGDFASGLPHNRLLVSLCQAMGVDVDTFGDPVYGSGGVPGLDA